MERDEVGKENFLQLCVAQERGALYYEANTSTSIGLVLGVSEENANLKEQGK